MAKKLNNVIEFYGATCPHCISMKPIIADLEKENGLEITKLEVWEHPENEQKMQEYADIIGDACGGLPGVPSFVNTETNQALCGEHDKADILALINGADCKDNACKPHSKMKKA